MGTLQRRQWRVGVPVVFASFEPKLEAILDTTVYQKGMKIRDAG
jgi:hypothetical protein